METSWWNIPSILVPPDALGVPAFDFPPFSIKTGGFSPITGVKSFRGKRGFSGESGKKAGGFIRSFSLPVLVAPLGRSAARSG